MVNEYQYCPRLAYWEWVQVVWIASGVTVEVDHAHRRVDRSSKDFPEADDIDQSDVLHGRSIAAFERRLSQEITHPLFGYKVNYRRLFEIQARLFGRYLLGELPEYPNFTTR